MQPSEDSVDGFIDGITDPTRQRDARALLKLFREATGEEPRMWGTIVGFGQYDYRYESGHSGTAPAAGFSPRKTASTIYLNDGVGSHVEKLGRLGPHRTGKGCVYLKNLEQVDLDVLGQIVADSSRILREGTYTTRAGEGGTTS